MANIGRFRKWVFALPNNADSNYTLEIGENLSFAVNSDGINVGHFDHNTNVGYIYSGSDVIEVTSEG